MKIIATGIGGELVVTASKAELAQILGYRSDYERGFDPSRVRVGAEINVSKFAHAMRAVSGTAIRRRLEQLRDIASELAVQADKAIEVGGDIPDCSLEDSV